MQQIPTPYIRFMMYTVDIVFMFASAHFDNIAYTCAFGFLLVFLYLGDLLHDVNVSMAHLLYLFGSSVIDEESEE